MVAEAFTLLSPPTKSLLEEAGIVKPTPPQAEAIPLIALGENVLLLVNLAWSAVLYIRFLGGRGSFTSLERWQTNYLPVYAAWAAIVVIVFPPLFRYI